MIILLSLRFRKIIIFGSRLDKILILAEILKSNFKSYQNMIILLSFIYFGI